MSVYSTATDAYYAMLADHLLAALSLSGVRMIIGSGGIVEGSDTVIQPDASQTALAAPRLSKALTEVYKSDDFTVVAVARVEQGDMSESASEAGLDQEGEGGLWFIRNFSAVPVADMEYFDVKIEIPFKTEV